MNGSNGFVLQGTSSGLGKSVSGAGDLNGDGFADLLIGHPQHYQTLAFEVSGATYVVFGGMANPRALDVAGGNPADGRIF